MTFHAKQEFPDYPYVNATYADVKAAYKAIHNKVVRFAGEGSRLPALVPHRLPISKAGVQSTCRLRRNPPLARRIYTVAETLHNYGYRFITADEMK